MASFLDEIPKSLKNNLHLQADANNKLITFVGDLIYDFINQKNLLRSRINIIEKKINKLYSTFSEATKIICEQLDLVTEEEPQKIIIATTDILMDKALFTKLFEISIKYKVPNTKVITYKLDFISDFHEIIEFFRFPAYLLSKRQMPYERILNKDQIFKQFKIFGLNNGDIDKIRLIRNSIKHKYEVNDKFLITKTKEEISIEYIEQLFKKLLDILNWSVLFIYSSTYLIPKFGILYIISFYKNISENDEVWSAHIKGLETFFREIFEKMEEDKKKQELKKKSLKSRIRRAKRKISYFFKYKIIKKTTKKKLPKSFEAVFPEFIEMAYHHSTVIGSELEIMANKLQDDIVKHSLIKAVEWFKDKSNDFKLLREYFIENPEKIKEYVKSPKMFVP